MYKHEDIFINIFKNMLALVVSKVFKKLHIISHSQNTPIHAVEIQNHNSLLYSVRIRKLTELKSRLRKEN